jgi:hypothetical protein
LSQTATLARTLAAQKENHNIENYSAISAFVIPEAEQQKRIVRWNAYWSDAKRQQLISVASKRHRSNTISNLKPFKPFTIY